MAVCVFVVVAVVCAGFVSALVPVSGVGVAGVVVVVVAAVALVGQAFAERPSRGSGSRFGRRFGRDFDDVAIGMMILTPQLKMVWVNAALCALLGREAQGLVGRSILEFTHPDDVRRSVQWSESRLKGNKEAPLTKRYIRPDGSIVDVAAITALVHPRGAEAYLFSQVLDVTEQRRAERETAVIAEQRGRLLGELIRARDTERRRIAADIHGDTLQVLAAARLRLEQLQDSLREPEQHAAAGELDTALAAAQRRLRNLLFELWPPSLEQAGLRAAISELLARSELESNLTIRLKSNLAHEPPIEVRSIVFRVVAEALSNVRRHARATSVEVELSERDGEVVARISDDGVGFDPTTAPLPGHIGLLEMRERAQTVGARISITSTPGHGTSVELRFPLQALPASR